jgi:hypothetical protein
MPVGIGNWRRRVISGRSPPTCRVADDVDYFRSRPSARNLIRRFRQPRFWIVSVLPTIRELSRGGSNRNGWCGHLYR